MANKYDSMVEIYLINIVGKDEFYCSGDRHWSGF